MILNANIPIYGVIGDPVAQSKGPLMHNTAFSHLGISGAYVAFRVTDLKSAIAGIRALNICGISVTIPHKVEVMDYLDAIDPQAKRIGAVNTVVNKNNHLIGYNSDGIGAVMALEEKTEVKNRTVALLGAGGAARSIGFCLKDKGCELIVLNRTKAKGEQLSRDLGARFHPLSKAGEIDFDILINTTSVGMFPEENKMPVSESVLKPPMVVMDIVYNPLETRLLTCAKKNGCTTIDGVSMFVYQGAFQFELWTGRTAPVEIMRKTVMDALSKADSEKKQ